MFVNILPDPGTFLESYNAQHTFYRKYFRPRRRMVDIEVDLQQCYERQY